MRSGDPFGLFATVARIPADALILVYPKVLPLPFWQLPGSFLEGNVPTGQRSLQPTSMVMGIRDYRAGDAMNRIHWPSSVRHRGLFVKEFELDKTADLWIFLDLERHWHRGEGETSTEERAVTVAASVVSKALREHRNVGLVTTGVRAEILHPDRGTKQFGKLMQYLAEVQVGGSRTIAEVMVETLPIYLVMILIYPASIAQAGWVDLNARWTYVALAGALLGTIVGNGRIRTRRSTLLGALAGALTIVIFTIVASDGSSLHAKTVQLAVHVNNWTTQILAGESATDPTVFVLVIGATCWASTYLGA